MINVVTGTQIRERENIEGKAHDRARDISEEDTATFPDYLLR